MWHAVRRHAHDSIWANRYTAGTGWGTRTLIDTDNAIEADEPQIAIDASGNALAVWPVADPLIPPAIQLLRQRAHPRRSRPSFRYQAIVFCNSAAAILSSCAQNSALIRTQRIGPTEKCSENCLATRSNSSRRSRS